MASRIARARRARNCQPCDAQSANRCSCEPACASNTAARRRTARRSATSRRRVALPSRRAAGARRCRPRAPAPRRRLRLGSAARGSRADQRSQQMRHDESDEADDARHRDAGADDQADADRQLPLRAIQIDAERACADLAERQRIERSAASRVSASQPTTMSGAAMSRSSKLRSVSAPSIQRTISPAAHGLGDSESTSEMPATASALRMMPGQHQRERAGGHAGEQEQARPCRACRRATPHDRQHPRMQIRRCRRRC